jgi:hypothetical protein
VVGVSKSLETWAVPSLGSRLPGWSQSTPDLMTGANEMADLVFVILIAAFFAVAALIVKGVERL